MPARPWKYMYNQFLSATDGSRTTMLTIASDHVAKLVPKVGSPPDPIIQDCLDRVQPLFDDFQLKLVTWQNVSGMRKGQTQMLDELLTALRTVRIRQWISTVQLSYVAGTPQFTQIFPQGQEPFYTGGNDQRILAVSALAGVLGNFPEFAGLKASVETFHATLKAARDTQQGSEGEIKEASDAAEAARVALAIGLYANLGNLMAKHAANPLRLAEYFEISLLRTSNSGSALPPGGMEEPPTQTIFSYYRRQDGPTTWAFWFQHPQGVTGVTNVLLVEGEQQHSALVNLEPGQSQQVVWDGVSIDGELDEIVLRDAENNVLAVGELDPELPDPGV